VRALVLAAAVTALLAVVALASGSRPGGGSGGLGSTTRTLLVDYLTALAILAVPLGALLVTAALFVRRVERLKPTATRGRVALLPAPLLLALLVVGLLLSTHYRGRIHGRTPTTATLPAAGTPKGRSRAHARGPASTAHYDWLAIVVILSVLGSAGAVAIVYATRIRRGMRTGEPWTVEALVDVLDDAIDDLRHEDDPRRAVIAAYARMEQTLAFHGAPRRPFEAPLEYLARLLAEQRASETSVRRLTSLFERAKFSRHTIDARMKGDAIDALVALRAELQAAAEPAAA
jgi:hypothetical protein